jgi:hypothetical protein
MSCERGIRDHPISILDSVLAKLLDGLIWSKSLNLANMIRMATMLKMALLVPNLDLPPWRSDDKSLESGCRYYSTA